MRARSVRRLVVAALAVSMITLILVGVRLGFERSTEHLPWSVMPADYRALGVPAGVTVDDDSCAMRHRGFGRRYTCAFDTAASRSAAAAAFDATLRAGGWRRIDDDRYARDAWEVRMRYSDGAAGITRATMILTRDDPSDD